MSISVVVCVVGWILGWVALGRPRRVDELPPPDHGGGRTGLSGVTVVIPARDEEANIATLLAGLCDPDDPTHAADRIVVVDDHSSDRTAALASSHPGVEVLTAPPLPAHWTGKSWACHAGVQHLGTTDGRAAPEQVVAFVDADVRLTRTALARVVAARDDTGGLVSVQPWHETERPYEQLSCLFNVLAVMGTAMGSRRGPTGAFGPLLVTGRADYDAVGGHAAVRDEVVEDLALARRYRSSGLPVQVLEGGQGLRFRMYPGGLRQVVEGWTKNFAVGAGSTRLLRLGAIVTWVTCLGSAVFALEDSLRGDLPLGTGPLLYVAFVLQLRVMFRQVGDFRLLTAVLYPVPLVFFMVVFVRSLWRTHVRRSVVWRGRSLSTSSSHR